MMSNSLDHEVRAEAKKMSARDLQQLKNKINTDVNALKTTKKSSDAAKNITIESIQALLNDIRKAYDTDANYRAQVRLVLNTLTSEDGMFWWVSEEVLTRVIPNLAALLTLIDALDLQMTREFYQSILELKSKKSSSKKDTSTYQQATDLELANFMAHPLCVGELFDYISSLLNEDSLRSFHRLSGVKNLVVSSAFHSDESVRQQALADYNDFERPVDKKLFLKVYIDTATRGSLPTAPFIEECLKNWPNDQQSYLGYVMQHINNSEINWQNIASLVRSKLPTNRVNEFNEALKAVSQPAQRDVSLSSANHTPTTAQQLFTTPMTPVYKEKSAAELNSMAGQALSTDGQTRVEALQAYEQLQEAPEKLAFKAAYIAAIPGIAINVVTAAADVKAMRAQLFADLLFPEETQVAFITHYLDALAKSGATASVEFFALCIDHWPNNQEQFSNEALADFVVKYFRSENSAWTAGLLKKVFAKLDTEQNKSLCAQLDRLTQHGLDPVRPTDVNYASRYLSTQDLREKYASADDEDLDALAIKATTLSSSSRQKETIKHIYDHVLSEQQQESFKDLYLQKIDGIASQAFKDNLSAAVLNAYHGLMFEEAQLRFRREYVNLTSSGLAASGPFIKLCLSQWPEGSKYLANTNIELKEQDRLADFAITHMVAHDFEWDTETVSALFANISIDSRKYLSQQIGMNSDFLIYGYNQESRELLHSGNFSPEQSEAGVTQLISAIPWLPVHRLSSLVFQPCWQNPALLSKEDLAKQLRETPTSSQRQKTLIAFYEARKLVMPEAGKEEVSLSEFMILANATVSTSESEVAMSTQGVAESSASEVSAKASFDRVDTMKQLLSHCHIKIDSYQEFSQLMDLFRTNQLVADQHKVILAMHLVNVVALDNNAIKASVPVQQEDSESIQSLQPALTDKLDKDLKYWNDLSGIIQRFHPPGLSSDSKSLMKTTLGGYITDRLGEGVTTVSEGDDVVSEKMSERSGKSGTGSINESVMEQEPAFNRSKTTANTLTTLIHQARANRISGKNMTNKASILSPVNDTLKEFHTLESKDENFDPNEPDERALAILNKHFFQNIGYDASNHRLDKVRAKYNFNDKYLPKVLGANCFEFKGTELAYKPADEVLDSVLISKKKSSHSNKSGGARSAYGRSSIGGSSIGGSTKCPSIAEENESDLSNPSTPQQPTSKWKGGFLGGGMSKGSDGGTPVTDEQQTHSSVSSSKKWF